MASHLLANPRCTGINRFTALTVLGRLRARRGDPGVWSLLDDALAFAGPTNHLQRLWPVAAPRAEAAWLEGRLSDEIVGLQQAELLTQGLTNTELGSRLFISAKTVDQHVSRILTKLAVSSRREAAALWPSIAAEGAALRSGDGVKK